MNNTLRWSLLYSTATAALLAVGSHAAMAATLTGGGSTLAGPDYVNEFSDDHVTLEFKSYCLVGSGAGTSAFVSNNPVPLRADTTNCPAATTVAPIAYGMSDAVISSTQVTFFKTTYNQPLVQLPTFGTPITFPFNLAGKTNDGDITLTDAQICGIFSGATQDWHTIDSSISSGTPIKVAYRADGSGTSFLTTNHLKAVCPASAAPTTTTTVNAGVTTTTTTYNGFTSAQLAAMPTTSFASLFTANGVPANFTAATGSGGVEAFITNTSNSVSYLSPDWTDIALNNSFAGFPPVAAVMNAGTAVLPTVSDTTTALGSISTPTGADVSDQTKWAPLVPTPASGYPVVGWTQMFVATCYSTTGVASNLVNFLKDHYNISNSSSTLVDDITNNGFVPVPGSTDSAAATGFAAAINTVFLTGDSNHLNIANTGTGSANTTTCNASGVVGR